jgi:two-component sensor histidine kinase
LDQRLADLDIPRLLWGLAPSWVIKAACAVLGIGLAVILRQIVERITPGAAPFAFVYPAALLATLLGGWQAGVGTLFGTELLAWMYVVPKAAPQGGHTSLQVAAAILVALTASAVIAVGEGFRTAAQKVVAERNAKLAERELLFRELQHRVNNDFTIVNSLLDLQRRRSTDPETRRALEQAMGRVRSVARVHHHLYTLPDIGAIDFRQYLADLCAALAEAALPPTGLHLRCHCDEAYMPRSRAIAVGLVTNELVTNAIKHAFPNDGEGSIDVRFQRTEAGWSLSVSDDGIGLSPIQPKTGLGTSLLEEFARQAGGTLSLEGGKGTIARLTLPPSAAMSSADNDQNLA